MSVIFLFYNCFLETSTHFTIIRIVGGLCCNMAFILIYKLQTVTFFWQLTGFLKKCPPDYEMFHEFCYKLIDSSVSHGPWNESPPYCTDADAQLAMPKTNDAQEFLKAFLLNHDKLDQRYFVGLKKKKGKWNWIDDTPLLKDTQFSTPEDSSDGCGVMEDGQIRGTSCSQSLGYICELKTGKC